MEPQPDPAARRAHLNSVLARLGARLDWYWTLSPPGRAAFWATFGGWALDAYNQMTVGFVLPAVTAAFTLTPAQAGLAKNGWTRRSSPTGAEISSSRVPDAVQRERLRSGAPLIRDLSKGGMRNDPGSAAHHSPPARAA
jgi:hypothetical protein